MPDVPERCPECGAPEGSPVNTNTLEALDWFLRGLALKAESYRRAAAKADRPSTRGWCEGKAEAFEETAKELRELLRRPEPEAAMVGVVEGGRRWPFSTATSPNA